MPSAQVKPLYHNNCGLPLYWTEKRNPFPGFTLNEANTVRALLGKTKLPGKNGSLGPILDVQFLEEVADMVLDRFLGEDHHIGNFRVAEPL